MQFLGDLPPLDRVTSGSGGIARGGPGKSLEAGNVEMEVGGVEVERNRCEDRKGSQNIKLGCYHLCPILNTFPSAILHMHNKETNYPF